MVTSETVVVSIEHLGNDATEADARKMVELLRAEGYDARYGTDGNCDAVPDDVWHRLLDWIGKKICAMLMDYETGERIRSATESELSDSITAAEHDGGAGVISVEIDGETVRCYVIE